MTEAMPFLQKTILLSYDPRPSARSRFAFMQGDHFIRTFMHIPLHLHKIAVI